MKISFNPSNSNKNILDLIKNNKDIIFDLKGHSIFARGVEFKGTDTNTWRDIKINNVSIGSSTLDLRNGSNTTLTNTNGVVTINSTWRPVVDNLTSDSTTSSLSAKQGKVLKALIDGKSNSDHNHDGRYLKLTGGTMASNAMITFADSGSWNTNKGPQGARGGLYWTGQSDYAKLYAEETVGDNLDLVIQFGDDNSNGLSIRNKANTQTSYISSSGVITTGTFKGNLDWSYITNKPSSYTPSAHTHAWNSLTHSSTTENQAILTNGKANGWKLQTLNIARWDNAANNAHSHANKSVLDGITSALVNSWNTAYNFVSNITGTDTDKVINKWEEIVNFLAGITEDNKLNTLLNSKLSIQQLSAKDILTTKTNNALFWVDTKGNASTITTGPFTDHPYALLSVTNYNQNAENHKFFYRSRLAFSSAGDIKVSSCHYEHEYQQDETWYNVLTSKNSGISGSTIKLNGTSITVYSSGTADGRYVKKSGDTMQGVLTIDTTNFGALTIKRNDDANGASIQFRGKSSVYGYIGLNNSTKDKQFLRWSSDTSRIYTILDTSSTYISNGKGVINGNEITQVNNSDTVDGWHKDEINRTLYITSNTAGLSSYWAKLWEINLNRQYNDVTITFLAAASYYPSYFSIFSVYLRQNGSGTSKNISARLVELIGNIAIGDTDLRLYVNNTTGNCQLWGNVRDQYGTLNLSVLKKAWRTKTDSPNIGTFFYTNFNSVQPLPGDGWSKIGVTQQLSTGVFNPTTHTHTVFKNNLMIKGTNGISDSASIHLGIGDSDTGFKWISDGVCQIYANNAAVGQWTSGGMNWFKNPTVNGNKVWNAGNDGSGSGLDADTLDGYHAASFVKMKQFRFNQYKEGFWTKILTITINSTSDLQPVIAFNWIPSECAREVWAEFTINWRSNSPIFYAIWKGTAVRTLTCVNSSGNIWNVWVQGDKNSYDPFGEVQVTYAHNISSYNGGSLGYSDSDPGGTRCTLGGYVNYARSTGNADTVDGQHASAFSYKSWWHWYGKDGQPNWLWGGNNENDYYVYNPSNFRVAYAASAGNADTLDGEHASSFVRAGHYESNDLNKLDTYSFIRSVNSNVSSTSPKGNTGWYNVIQLVHRNGASDGPSYIGQIALGMTTNTNDMFFRGKRTDPWKTVIHSGNYTEFINNYYWANVKISTSSSTTTSPTVSNLTATNSIRLGNIHLEHTNEINSYGGLLINYRSSADVDLCQGGGNVCIGATLPTQKLDVRGNIITKGLGIQPYYLSKSVLLPTIRLDDGYTYKCLEISATTEISCIIADRAGLMSERGILIKFNKGYDGQIILLKDLQSYGSGNGYFWVMPSGCKIMSADNSSILVGQNQISNTYDDGRSRFLVYSSVYSVWIEFLCSNTF